MLIQVTDEKLEEIKRQWLELVDEDIFNVELEPYFLNIPQDVKPFAVQKDANSAVDAIVELFSGVPGQTKMLKFVESPRFWTNESDPDTRQDYIETLITLITEVIQYGTQTEDTFEVKLYGRGDALYNIFKSIARIFQLPNTGLEAKISGRWLIVKPTKGGTP